MICAVRCRTVKFIANLILPVSRECATLRARNQPHVGASRIIVGIMTGLYKPRPERWPQFSLRGLLLVLMLAAVLSATVLPRAIAAIREWMRPPPSYTVDG